MSVNNFKPHVLVLPEDDANHQLANGFLLDESLDSRAIQVLPNAGGWPKVRERFSTAHINGMERHKHRYLVLLVDFDKNRNRWNEMRRDIPDNLADRVFVIGVWSEPEDLRKAKLGSPEDVGRKLAKECREGSSTVWSDDLLEHNSTELSRMTPLLKPILFPA